VQRYFVLRDGVLQYYKVSASKRAAVLAMIKHELSASDAQFLGAGAYSALQEAERRCAAPEQQPARERPFLPLDWLTVTSGGGPAETRRPP
jgi:hypothetical protein